MPPKICNHCGFFNSYTTRYCKRCGEEIQDSDASNQSRQLAKVKKALAEKYIVTDEIGKGGMAIVYKAIQKNLDRVVAIKVIKDDSINEPEAVQRFHEEARLAGGLNHPNIITIFDNGEIAGIHYMVMEYLEGDDLFTIIKKAGVLDEKIFKTYFIQIANALHYLRELNLVHKDIKSSNIFITKSGRPVLMDFGISSLKNRVYALGNDSILGTPEYMSPEQIKGGILDERSDLYSLGVVMYEAFTGRLPFKGATYNDTLQLILEHNPLPPQSINPRVCKSTSSIILQLLSKQPEYRFQTGQELSDALSGKKIKAKVQVKDGFKRLLIASIISVGLILCISLIFVLSPGSSKTDSPNPVKSERSNLPTLVTNPDNTNNQNSSTGIGHQNQTGKIEISNERSNGQVTTRNRKDSRPANTFDSSIDQANSLLQDGISNDSRDKILEAKRILESASGQDQQSEYTKELIKYCDSLASTMPPN